MAETITITIKNRSTADRAFLLFQALPTPGGVSSEQVFTHVYQKSPTIGGNAHDQVTFQITKEYFAIYGTNRECFLLRAKISTLGYSKATLQSTPATGAANGSTFSLSTLNRDGVSPTFESTDQTTTARGGFTMLTDASFRFMNKGNIYLGVGVRDSKTGQVVPIQTCRAQPNYATIFYPVARYYICYGNLEGGSVVKKFEIGRVLSLEFTGSSHHNMTFTLDEHDEYQIDPAMAESNVVWKSDMSGS
ncbi:hypothetical protein FCULG_00000102 [Fusarium culmorum]|uniref:Uncharacterized protein n=1 Tax=Fusarium culmorum TaxID=5516 RepID=A0A2T4GND6_FUSCU|nr:hypothetical protein FCULG_00000102 [Fusarium culmorum]